MQPQHAISSPQQAGDYPERDMDCLAALRPSVADLATTSADTVSAVMAGDLPEPFAEVARRAEQAGWRRAEAEAAIRHLAREYEGAKGTIFD